jgi:hypothetical protein
MNIIVFFMFHLLYDKSLDASAIRPMHCNGYSRRYSLASAQQVPDEISTKDSPADGRSITSSRDRDPNNRLRQTAARQQR